MTDTIYEAEDCDAGIAGGCGACTLCDPDWWHALWSAQEKPDDVDLAFYLDAGGDA